jgi:hypothetical protein
VRFLVLISPIIKFLIIKYQSNIALQGVESEILMRFKAAEILSPQECRAFIQIITSIRKHLIDNNIIYQREALKKLVGDGSSWKGFLNLLVDQGHAVFTCPYEPGMMQKLSSVIQKMGNGDLSDIRIIMPLNLDENEEIYTFFHKELNLPIYPLMCNDATSKWLKNFTFAPLAPRSFYFPEGTNAGEFAGKISELATKHGIEHVILKDEYDFDIRPILPYAVVPVSKMDQACRVFYDKVKGIPNYGGLVLEEFLVTGDTVDIFTMHIFGKIIPASIITDKVRLKPYKDGGLFDSFVQDVMQKVTDIVPPGMDKLDLVVSRYYSYLFSSIEFILHKNVPRVIDVNSVSNSMKFEKPVSGLNPDSFFKVFIDRVVSLSNSEENERQTVYHDTIKRIYARVRQFGPAFFDGEKVTSLVDGVTKDVKDFLE